MAFVLEGLTAKLEVTRGILNTLRYWPRQDGKLVVPSAPAILALADPTGAAIAGASAPAVQGDNSITFTWTPPAATVLDEDFRFDIQWTDPGGGVHQDRVYFDVCRFVLSCPLDTNAVQQMEPSLTKWLTGGGLTDAQTFIQTAWDGIVLKVRGKGFRPGLITDKSNFVLPAAHLAASYCCNALIRATGDVFEGKREWHKDQYKTAWADIGALKFEDVFQLGQPVGARAPNQPRWRR